MWSAPSASTIPSAARVATTSGFARARRSGDTVGLGDLAQLGELRRPLRIDEIDAFQVEHDRVHLGLVLLDHRPQAPVERLGGGEEEPAVEPNDADPGERLVSGVLVQLAEHLGAGLTAEQRHPRRGCDVDEPDE